MTEPTTSAVVDLGELSLRFGRVDRITFHEDGVTPESDTDHTVMLGLIACAFAQKYFAPHLDVDLIAEYCLIHDLVEVYAGDTPTIRLQSAEQKAEKEAREQEGFLELAELFGTRLPWVAKRIAEYETRQRPEARYVKAMDKMMPKITHLLNAGKSFRDQGITRAEAVARYAAQGWEIAEYAAASEFPELWTLRAELMQLVFERADFGGEA